VTPKASFWRREGRLLAELLWATAAAGPAPEPLPLCAHCGLPLTGRRNREPQTAPSYCCSGCALAHRLTVAAFAVDFPGLNAAAGPALPGDAVT